MNDLQPISHNPSLDLMLERTTPVPVELVWRAWTEPELLKQWFCPKPWSVSEVKLELYPGGAFNTTMQSPEGEQFPSEGCILQVVPQRRLVFTSALIRGFRPQPPEGNPVGAFLFSGIVDLEAEGSGTRYRAYAIHGDAEGRNSHEAMGFHDGWGAAFDQLVELMSSPELRG